MDGLETVLYPRYLPKYLPKEGKTACVAGQVVDISDSKSLTLECDSECKSILNKHMSSWL